MSEIIFRLLFILVIAIAIFLIGIVAGSIVGKHLKKQRSGIRFGTQLLGGAALQKKTSFRQINSGQISSFMPDGSHWTEKAIAISIKPSFGMRSRLFRLLAPRGR